MPSAPRSTPLVSKGLRPRGAGLIAIVTPIRPHRGTRRAQYARAHGEMSGSFDVIVVGARCAGAPLAALLARRGLRVCVLERDRFPSDTLSTHAIQPTGVSVLRRLGVLEHLTRLAPPITRARL